MYCVVNVNDRTVNTLLGTVGLDKAYLDNNGDKDNFINLVKPHVIMYVADNLLMTSLRNLLSSRYVT